MIIIDANIVLRYLLKDDEKLFENAKELIETKVVLVTNEVFAEIVYVLEKVYKIPKIEISGILSEIVNKSVFRVNDIKMLLAALNYYSKYNLDFVDSILLAYNKINHFSVSTFDKYLAKLVRNEI